MAEQPKTYYAVTREHAERWDASRGLHQQDQWDEHARLMDALVDEGVIVLGGPLADGDHVLLIFHAGSREAVETHLASDPWSQMGLLRTTRIQRWDILLDGRR